MSCWYILKINLCQLLHLEIFSLILRPVSLSWAAVSGLTKLRWLQAGSLRAGGATLRPRSGAAAGRRHPESEVRGNQEKTPQGQDQRCPGEATLCLRPGAVTLRSHPEPEARDGTWEEPPTPKARAGGWEEQPEEWWLPSRGGPRGAIPR